MWLCSPSTPIIEDRDPSTHLNILTTRDWKLIEFHADGRRELFNLAQDPGEKVNLVVKRADVAKRLAARLDRWCKETGAVMPQKNPNADPNWPGLQLTGGEKPTAPA